MSTAGVPEADDVSSDVTEEDDHVARDTSVARINVGKARHVQLNPLVWYNHDVAPKKLKITNTGYTVILSAKWQTERPYLVDGPFLDNYVFSQLHFHWGVNDMCGSEHRPDGACAPMELHAVYFKAEYRTQGEAQRHDDGLAILVHLFKLDVTPNPALAWLLEALPRIRDPGASTRIERPEPLVGLTRPFSDDYMMYRGALPGADEQRPQPVLWIISREPIGVTSEQTQQFRYLLNSKYEPLLNNCRAASDESPRTVLHVNPSGNTHVTLLAVPRDPPPLTANQLAAEIVANYKGSGTEEEQ